MKDLKEVKVYLYKSSREGKKWTADFPDGPIVHFGAKEMSDYTKHKDPERKKRYLARHKANEDWTKRTGLYTAGFWSKHLLWNKPGLMESIRDMEKRFNLRIIRKRL